jgi:ribosomal protein S18 acetylase RimI-like enzyme
LLVGEHELRRSAQALLRLPVSSELAIRRAEPAQDADVVWAILEPMIRDGETYALPRDMTREAALAYWFAPANEVWVSCDPAGGDVLGTYFVRPNLAGFGAHVANCGYVTAPAAMSRGVARAMCRHSLARAIERGFRAMQFNFVVSTNERAVRLWQQMGFAIVGTLPNACVHPRLGDVDAYVMFRAL